MARRHRGRTSATTWRRAISMRAYRARAWAHRSARCRRSATGVNLTDSQKASLVNGFSITNPADGHWAYSIASPDFLPAGSSVELSYPVTVDDHHGGTANQAVTITLDGTNDAPLPFHDIAGGA